MEFGELDKPTDVEWLNPVYVKIADRPPERISGPAQALVCLAQQWPAQLGKEPGQARAECVSAMAGKLDAEYARKAFVNAALKANVVGFVTSAAYFQRI